MDHSEHRQALPQGYRLNAYRLIEVLGVGGFGVTYLADDARLERRVAVKEYLPNEFAMRDGTMVHPKSRGDREDFEWGLARFLDEARTLARFRHPNVVRVVEYFEANGTAYIVMDYEEGEPLDRLLERHGTLTEAQLRRVLLPVVDGLREVHAAGYLHRDIKPSNVFVRHSDESPVLLDFGAARQALGRMSKSLTAVASAGYSPPEQYESEGEQGPWTDIYALSALCYRAITGEAPIEAPRRQGRLARGQPDPLPKLAKTGVNGYSVSFLECVDRGLRVIDTERPANLDEWMVLLEGGSTAAAPAGAATDSLTVPGTGVDHGDEDRRRSRTVVMGVAAAVTATVLAVGAYVFNEFSRMSSGPASDRTAASDAPPPARVPGAKDDAEGPPLIGGGNAILVVETEPTGVEVVVGGEVVGRTPLERRDMLAGSREVRLRHPRYQTVTLADQTFADGEVLRIDRALLPGVGKLTVVTRPREAWIERDGERVAAGTPVTLEGLPAGPVELRLGADEHRSILARAEVPKNGVALLERTLERIPHGTLTLELVPADASVTLPDVAPSYRPGMRLPEGPHRVIVRREGYRESSRTVEVAGDTRERIELAKGPQPFTVEAAPRSAAITLAGVGDGYRPGMLLEPGEYRVRVSAPEYETLEETVVHGATPTRHSVALVRSPQPFTVVAAPATATVVLVGVAEAYRAGMRLAPGEYRVRVSLPEYETREEVIRHGMEPTRYGVMLERAIPSPGSTFADDLRSGGKGPEMVVIPPGRFRMGCVSGLDCAADEKPVHEVAIAKPFALSVYEVTFAQWDACAAAGGCNGHRPDGMGWGRGDRPVIAVSWEDAQFYVLWLARETGQKYRLPSESEWEYAARAGTATRYSWGNDIGRNRANCDECGSSWDDEKTAPVGSFVANAWGVHDMHGNVWEWVEDCSNGSYAGAPSDGGPWESGYCAAAPGTSTRGTSAPRTGSGSPPASASTTSGSVWPGRSPHESLHPYVFGVPRGLCPLGREI